MGRNATIRPRPAIRPGPRPPASAGRGLRLLGPPPPQRLLGGLTADRALLEPQLEEEGVRPAEYGARPDAEHPGDLVAVELRADRRQLLQLEQRGDPGLEVVVRARQH